MVLITIPLGGLICLIVQAIYVYRLVKLNGDLLWMKVGFGILITLAFGMSVSSVFSSFRSPYRLRVGRE
jgi:hypothetical protein